MINHFAASIDRDSTHLHQIKAACQRSLGPAWTLNAIGITRLGFLATGDGDRQSGPPRGPRRQHPALRRRSPPRHAPLAVGGGGGALKGVGGGGRF